jgi:hypothetical protein
VLTGRNMSTADRSAGCISQLPVTIAAPRAAP